MDTFEIYKYNRMLDTYQQFSVYMKSKATCLTKLRNGGIHLWHLIQDWK